MGTPNQEVQSGQAHSDPGHGPWQSHILTASFFLLMAGLVSCVCLLAKKPVHQVVVSDRIRTLYCLYSDAGLELGCSQPLREGVAPQPAYPVRFTARITREDGSELAVNQAFWIRSFPMPHYIDLADNLQKTDQLALQELQRQQEVSGLPAYIHVFVRNGEINTWELPAGKWYLTGWQYIFSQPARPELLFSWTDFAFEVLPGQNNLVELNNQNASEIIRFDGANRIKLK